MNNVQPIRLNADLTIAKSESMIKTCARLTFRSLRSAVAYSKEVPGLIQQAKADIREAWEETSRPNA